MRARIPPQYWSAANSAAYGSALGYIPEAVWNESALDGGTGLWASGGGASTVYTQPVWQWNVSGDASANGMRAVPDVSLSAADHDGYFMVENGAFWVVSGTSVTAPAFAGIMALVGAKENGIGQGSANPRLYALTSAVPNPFHPTPSGNNSVPGVEGFSADGATYNLATGLGSVDGAVLVNGWNTSSTSGSADARFDVAGAIDDHRCGRLSDDSVHRRHGRVVRRERQFFCERLAGRSHGCVVHEPAHSGFERKHK